MHDGSEHSRQLTVAGIDPGAIANVMLEGIWVCDRDAITAFVNPRMAEILLTEPASMIGRVLFDYFHADEQPLVRSKWRERMRGQSDAYEIGRAHV